MGFRRTCHALLVAAALSSIAVMAQTSLRQSGVVTPSSTTEFSQAKTDTNSCAAIAAGDTRLAPISRLCEFALTYFHELPDFICQQTTTESRDQSTTVLTAQVTYRQGLEHYSDVRINGRPQATNSVARVRAMAFNTNGEFGSFLVGLFKPPIVTRFRFRKEAMLQGNPVTVYEFDVPAAHSFWTVRDSKDRVLRPEWQGQIWLEQATGRLLKIEIQAVRLPAGFEAASVHTVTAYDRISLEEAGTFVLPIRSETDICFRSSTGCMKNVLAFHDCQKFGATTRILGYIPEP